MARRRLSVWIGLLICMAGCGGTGGGSGGGSGSPPVSATIGGGGGTVVDGNATLAIGAGVLAQSSLISVQQTTQYPADTRVVSGTAYAFSSSGAGLTQSVRISIRYNAATLKTGVAENSLRLFQVAGNAWSQVSDSSVDTNNKIVTGTTTTLGTFAILSTVGGGTGGVSKPTALLFLSDVGGTADINGNVALNLFAVNLGSTSAQQFSINGSGSSIGGLTGGTGSQTGETITHAAFSPDTKSLVFDDQSSNGNLLVLAQSNGSTVTVLLVGGSSSTGALQFPHVPSFSPDGTKIIFLYNQTGSDQIFTIKPDGTAQTQITTTLTGAIDNPAFTKAGNIRFITRGTGGTLKYNLMNPDGSGLTTTSTFSPAVAPWYTYSPDGTKIVYTAQASGKTDVFTMNADGSNPTQVTKLGANAIGSPRFSADNTKIIFDASTGTTTTRTLYTINVDGTNLQTVPVATTTGVNNYLEDAR